VLPYLDGPVHLKDQHDCKHGDGPHDAEHRDDAQRHKRDAVLLEALTGERHAHYQDQNRRDKEGALLLSVTQQPPEVGQTYHMRTATQAMHDCQYECQLEVPACLHEQKQRAQPSTLW
jgi:hypothetical protein